MEEQKPKITLEEYQELCKRTVRDFGSKEKEILV